MDGLSNGLGTWVAVLAAGLLFALVNQWIRSRIKPGDLEKLEGTVRQQQKERWTPKNILLWMVLYPLLGTAVVGLILWTLLVIRG